MKMTWIDAPGQVLEMEADCVEDLDVLEALMAGPLAGAGIVLCREDRTPWGATTLGWCHVGNGERPTRQLVGLRWDIRNQPAVGRPRSHADARLAQATQAICQGLHQFVGVIKSEREIDFGVPAAWISSIERDLQQ